MLKYDTIVISKPPDREKERSERRRSLQEFLDAYNKNLPKAFPRATKELLLEYRQAHRGFFKESGVWTLAEHRKKIMDWLPQRTREHGR